MENGRLYTDDGISDTYEEAVWFRHRFNTSRKKAEAGLPSASVHVAGKK